MNLTRILDKRVSEDIQTLFPHQDVGLNHALQGFILAIVNDNPLALGRLLDVYLFILGSLLLPQ